MPEAPRREGDRERPVRQVARRALAGGVDQLSADGPEREIFPDEAVVRQLAGPTGFEPVLPEVLTLEPLPRGRALVVVPESSDGLEGRPADPGEVGPDASCGADETVKRGLAWA